MEFGVDNGVVWRSSNSVSYIVLGVALSWDIGLHTNSLWESPAMHLVIFPDLKLHVVVGLGCLREDRQFHPLCFGMENY